MCWQIKTHARYLSRPRHPASQNSTLYEVCTYYLIPNVVSSLSQPKSKMLINISYFFSEGNKILTTFCRRRSLLTLFCGIPYVKYACTKKNKKQYSKYLLHSWTEDWKEKSHWLCAYGEHTCITIALCTFIQKDSFSSWFIFLGSISTSWEISDLQEYIIRKKVLAGN